MPREYEVIDNLIKDEILDFILWLEAEKEFTICELLNVRINGLPSLNYYPIHKAPEDLINEYMEIK